MLWDYLHKAQAEERLWLLVTYCFSVFIVGLFFVPTLHNIFHTVTAQYSMFVLQVPLNSDQPTNLIKLVDTDNAD